MKDKIKGIGGWLLLIIFIFFISAISNIYLLIQKIILLFNDPTKIGVYISAILLLIYCVLIYFSIWFTFIKKKAAVKFFIYAIITGTIFILWYYLIAWLIFTSNSFIPVLKNNLIAILFNLIINILVVIYLLKSKRVKNTLTK